MSVVRHHQNQEVEGKSSLFVNNNLPINGGDGDGYHTGRGLDCRSETGLFDTTISNRQTGNHLGAGQANRT